jgi:hypothetical protein
LRKCLKVYALPVTVIASAALLFFEVCIAEESTPYKKPCIHMYSLTYLEKIGFRVGHLSILIYLFEGILS